ncbi:hypothetical protein QTI66_01485 [Variovorax sp. J22R133]|uniref:PKD domain-containing protein n=1 Tax=Variovorax brevis TaxID=3053503 RepID=UPI002575AC94|nr:hypothetical protein [Variovorax sp. J22R133]MDM0110798.1 hypothetical protein [Variovorax sp. J22R133]
MNKTAIASIAISALLAACGGGGSDAAAPAGSGGPISTNSGSGPDAAAPGGSNGPISATPEPGAPEKSNPEPSAPKTNTAPVASVAAVQGAITGKAFTLDGSASADVDGDTLTFAWTIQIAPAGSAATLSVNTQAKPTFKADLAGDYVFALVVNDGSFNSPQVTVTVPVAKATWKDADCSRAGTDLPACATPFSDNLASVTVQQDHGVAALKFETLKGGPANTPSSNTGIKGNRATLGMDFLHGVKLSEFGGIRFKSKDDGTGETGAGLPYVTYSISKECDGAAWNNLITNLADMNASVPDANGYVTYTATIDSPSWKSTSWGTPIRARDGSTQVLPPNGAPTAATLGALIAEYPNACIYNWPNPSAADPTTAKTPAVMFMLGNSANTTAKHVWVQDLRIGNKSIF